MVHFELIKNLKLIQIRYCDVYFIIQPLKITKKNKTTVFKK